MLPSEVRAAERACLARIADRLDIPTAHIGPELRLEDALPFILIDILNRLENLERTHVNG